MIRLLACSFALACLLISTAADARHRHRATHYRHPIACQIVTGGGIHLVSRPCRNRLEEGIPVRGSRWVAASRHYAARWRGHRRAYVRRASEPNDASGISLRGGVARVCVAGHCGTVAAPLAEKFRGLFADFVALGYNIGSPGCLSSGHMRHSLHHWGGACDLFDQVARNRTARPQPPPSVQIEVASRHGLTAGCVWRSPDCGHFDVSGVGGGRHYARAHRGRRHIARNY